MTILAEGLHLCTDIVPIHRTPISHCKAFTKFIKHQRKRSQEATGVDDEEVGIEEGCRLFPGNSPAPGRFSLMQNATPNIRIERLAVAPKVFEIVIAVEKIAERSLTLVPAVWPSLVK